MPELAEVETIRKHIGKVLKGKKIAEIQFDDKDRWLFAFAKHSDVKKALVGATIKGAGRKGKYFWLELDRKPWPIFHLGMSGNISLLEPKKKSHRRIWGGDELWEADEKDEREILWHSRLLIIFEKDFEMAFTDPRRFGRMWLTDDPMNHPRIKKLGFDPLIDFPAAKILGEKLKKRKKSIKSVLLEQNLFAGIGNWLADEILYQSRISPHRKASELKLAEVKTLHKKTLDVTKKAVDVMADYQKFPKNWLFHNRWELKGGMTSRKQKIKREDIGGRTSAWVPGWQR